MQCKDANNLVKYAPVIAVKLDVIENIKFYFMLISCGVYQYSSAIQLEIKNGEIFSSFLLVFVCFVFTVQDYFSYLRGVCVCVCVCVCVLSEAENGVLKSVNCAGILMGFTSNLQIDFGKVITFYYANPTIS